jgi:cyclophilin family peptidyl-prolyl cis-trans isomerase
MSDDDSDSFELQSQLRDCEEAYASTRTSPAQIRFMANPQSPSVETLLPFVPIAPSENYNNPYRRKTGQRVSWVFATCLIIGCAFGFISRQVVGNTREQVLAMENTRNMLYEKSVSVEGELDRLKRQINAIGMMSQTAQNPDQRNEIMKVSNIRAMHQMMKAQDRVDQSEKQADGLRKKIQASSLAGIYQKYGKGVHRVEFELVFADGKKGPTKFVLELAPSELMPHAVEAFLDMVSNKLIDGCSFIMSALNVIKASPIPYDGSSAKVKAQSFADLGLDQLAFKEYNPQFPHQKYTMGFTADGSPNFFLNTADNTFAHEGDPCFGKVVQGFDTIKRLESSPTRNGIWFTQRVGIKSATFLDNSSVSIDQKKRIKTPA